MIRLEMITEDNFYQVIGLKVADEERTFVASNVQSLAECWLYRDNGDVFPYAIYAEDSLVGFVLIDVDDDDSTYMIWRLMIDEAYQGRGYGRRTLEHLIQQARTLNYHRLRADYVTENAKMAHLLTRLGFVKIGEDEKEQWTVLDLRRKNGE
ncbi:GNAT family N-acetyltransferase [Streptococcus fryi]